MRFVVPVLGFIEALEPLGTILRSVFLLDLIFLLNICGFGAEIVGCDIWLGSRMIWWYIIHSLLVVRDCRVNKYNLS